MHLCNEFTLKDVASLQPLPEYQPRVPFDDGVEGIIDVAQLVAFAGVFEPLRDPTFFAQACVHPELGTMCWPNDADLDSNLLYARITGVPIPQYLVAKK